MSYRNNGYPAFEVAADFDENRVIGDLVRINTAGKITNKLGEDNLVFLPLIENVTVENTQNPTKFAGVQTFAVAKVTVEDASGIAPGVELGVGTDGYGAVLYTSGFKLGIALATPEGDDSQIPVLLVPTSSAAIY